jgi:hypothetical protein
MNVILQDLTLETHSTVKPQQKDLNNLFTKEEEK